MYGPRTTAEDYDWDRLGCGFPRCLNYADALLEGEPRCLAHAELELERWIVFSIAPAMRAVLPGLEDDPFV